MQKSNSFDRRTGLGGKRQTGRSTGHNVLRSLLPVLGLCLLSSMISGCFCAFCEPQVYYTRCQELTGGELVRPPLPEVLRIADSVAVERGVDLGDHTREVWEAGPMYCVDYLPAQKSPNIVTVGGGLTVYVSREGFRVESVFQNQ